MWAQVSYFLYLYMVFLQHYFQSEQHCFLLEQKVFSFLLTLQTDWVESSTQYSLVIKNYFSLYYPVFYHFGSTNPTIKILKWTTFMLRTSCVSSTGLMFEFGISSGGGTYFYGYYRSLWLMRISFKRYTKRIKRSNSISPIMNSFNKSVLHGYMNMTIGKTSTGMDLKNMHHLFHVQYGITGTMFLSCQ